LPAAGVEFVGVLPAAGVEFVGVLPAAGVGLSVFSTSSSSNSKSDLLNFTFFTAAPNPFLSSSQVTRIGRLDEQS